ncbi:undecaprenyl/decaprenyl-phosphate alpha-N-acetylglucosaminyl 1-phosphate transferase [Tamlana agarivorans]|uniref:Undecaprenyl/decaprenyl-phosphate alpha-N-acetylglucosaminyl 1-phosphate transferase n=1 Tax=Pseudotamlana agarivorans TaxID=481183 RepID=A0ACC5U7E2_9FLAO|nr:MraY family glycosyltransferase [Tamlana agarivorans]MBU2950253.1 undecaprenyl/decaprenyl-phosphate alpha-N-acetylglucosaminyl 1-phosphate transferase [Tamlana agarivorans]
MLTTTLSNPIILAIICCCGSFGLVNYMIPKIIFMVNHHNLSEAPGHRSSHTRATPTMGGLAFFVALIINLFLFKHIDVDAIGLNLAAALTLVFIIGFKDDLSVSTPRARLLIEAAAILIVLFHPGFHSSSLDGFLGFSQVPQLIIDALHILIILTIINAYNLIDGVDGLASAIGISGFSILALIFHKIDFHFYFILALVLISMLLAFLKYNFSHKKKIFMGDTGSLIIGFCLAFLCLRFLTMDSNLHELFSFKTENKFFLVSGILAVPFFDMLRVIGVRLLQGSNPLTADRNHIHHILLDLGLPHYKIALILGGLNYCLAILIFYLSANLNSFAMLGAILLIFLVLLAVFYRLSNRINTLKQTK